MNKKIRVGFSVLVILIFVGCAPVEMMEPPVTVAEEIVRESVSDIPESVETETSTVAESEGA